MISNSRSSRFGVLSALMAASALMGSSCTNGSIGEPGGSCQSVRSVFLTEVWGPVMAQKCVSCHTPGGSAQLRAARFRILPASYPDFADVNLQAAIDMSNLFYTVNGRQIPALLAKPLGLTTGMQAHGGGAVITEGSPEHMALANLVQRISGTGEDQCRDFGSLAAPSGVVQLNWHDTLRRSTLDLLGRLPTELEYRAGEVNEAGFEQVMTTLFEESAFYERWRTAFNDLLLTDVYVTNNGCDQRALNQISSEDFPNRGTYGGGAVAGLDCCNRDRMNPACDQVRTFFLNANNAIAQEPINLMEHVVRQNRPFSEILTADYTLVNAQSAHVYNVSAQAGFNDPYAAPGTLRPARVSYTRQYRGGRSETTPFPHAGLMTTPAFLTRYPTTTTNRNRHRARIIQSYFLATDILKVGERPLDPTASEALVQTPTMNYGPCSTCHTINDPIAGAFRGFFPDGVSWRYDPNDAWYTDMYPPGLNGENIPGTNYRNALQWLAPRIAQDPRFTASVVRLVYTGLTGRQPLAHPTDTLDPLYGARASAWVEQDRIFRAIARKFVASNMNFKIAVMEMLKSPLYRAIGSVMPADLAQREATITSHSGVGSSMMLTPEILDRRVRAIAGFSWVRDPNRLRMPDGRGNENHWLQREFYLPYGGINSDTIVRRANDPSGIITGVASRMATEVACRGTAWDFMQPQADRRFFRGVQLDTVPEAGGNTVPGNVTQIKQNMISMHELILGERLSIDDPEIERTFQLFLETWRETRMPNAMGMANNALPYECHGRQNPVTGEELPDAMRLTEDRNGTIRAWMAVMTYLFNDYRFLYQ